MSLPALPDLVRLSRDRHALIKTSLGIVAAAAVLALALSWLAPAGHGLTGLYRPPAPGGTEDLVSLVRFGLPAAETGDLSCFDLAGELRFHPFAEEIEAGIEDLDGTPEAELLGTWWTGLMVKDRTEVIRLLETLEVSLPHRNEALGDLRHLAGDNAGALEAYLEEAKRFPGAVYARRSALALARFEEDGGRLRAMLADAAFRAPLPAAALVPFQAWVRDHGGLVRSIMLAQLDLLRSAYVIPAILTAAIWVAILLSFRADGGRFAGIAGVAFLLGIASTVPILYLATVQEEMRGFRFRPEDAPHTQFLYFLAGVSLREEGLKLLFFAPLLPFLNRRGEDLAVLLLAGFTGLGFAFQENLAYFRSDASSYTAWLRLLTANALHFSLTGIAGYALWRLVRSKLHGLDSFAVSFLGVVLAHGLYNSLLGLPALAEYGVLAPFLVAVIAYRYFDPLREHLEIAGLHRRASPLGIFVIGSALLASTILVSSAATMPLRFAMGAFVSTLGSMIPLAFAYISRFRDL